MRNTLIITAFAITLAGCSTYKTYTRPQIDTDSLYGKGVAGTDTVSLGALSWQELFTDVKLQSLINTGLQNNSDLKIASLRVKEAEATLRASRLAYLPAVSATPQGQLSGFGSSAAAKTYSLALSADWEADVAGKLTNAERQSRATLNMQNAYRQAVQTQLIATIANSYYNLLTLDSQLDISQKTLSSWDETIRTLEAQKKVGEANDAAVSQAKANRLSVDASILTLQQQIREQENSLSVLIGDKPHAIGRSSLTEQTFPDSLSVGVPLQLLDNRPDIRQAEYNLQSAFYATNIARSAFYPQVTLSGTLGWTNNSGAAIVNPGKMLWNALASVTQPLFNRGQNRANLEIAKAQQEEALTSFQQSLLQAGAEVNNALTQWQTADKRLDVDNSQINALQKTVESTRLLLKYSDEKSYLEVLTAQQSLLQAELTKQQDIFNKIQGIINLYHALGGGSADLPM